MVAGTPFEIVDVYRAWPRIGARLARTRSPPGALHDIRRRCEPGGDAVCLEGPDGIVIVAAEPTAHGTTVAAVLLAVGTALHGAYKRQESAMLAIARDLGATELAFDTDRRGWARLLGPEWREQHGRFTRGV